MTAPYLQQWLDNDQLEETILDVARVRNRMAAARQHYEWALDVRASLPDQHAFHFEKGYDAIRAASGAVVAAHGVRLRGRGKTHEVPLDIAVATLRARRPDAADALAPLTGRLRTRRHRIQYEEVVLVPEAECEALFSVSTLVLEALEAVAYELIGLPPPGGWPRAT